MRWIRLAVVLVVAGPSIGSAQSGSVAGNSVAAQDSTPPAPKKKGGLFGKVKGLTKNKLVNTVAKTALCTAVPGGSMIASAVEAKKAKGVKDAAGAAANLTGASSGSCMPGMGLAGKLGSAASMASAVPGVGVPGLPTTGLQGAALSAAQLNQPASMPGGMVVRPEQLKQMEEQYRKMGMKPEQIKAMEAQIQAQQLPMSAAGGMPDQVAPSMPAAPAALSIAAAGQPGLSSEAGFLVVRGLAWMPATAVIRPDAQASFGLAMRDLASAVHQSGKHYKVVARVEDQGKKTLTRKLSQQRAAAVVAGLAAQGITAAQVKAGEGSADKDARILLQETK
jgi:hypothetical protein